MIVQFFSRERESSQDIEAPKKSTQKSMTMLTTTLLRLDSWQRVSAGGLQEEYVDALGGNGGHLLATVRVVPGLPLYIYRGPSAPCNKMIWERFTDNVHFTD